MSHQIAPETVVHMAKLSRLSVSEEEQALFARQFGDILDYMDVLSSVDTTGVDPLYSPVVHEARLREDQASHRRTREEILSNAPEKSDGLFMVPRIV